MNLKSKRIEKNMTQAEVAERIGITQCAYGNYELGKRSPKPDMLRKLANIFGCTIDELILEAENDEGRI